MKNPQKRKVRSTNKVR